MSCVRKEKRVPPYCYPLFIDTHSSFTRLCKDRGGLFDVDEKEPIWDVGFSMVHGAWSMEKKSRFRNPRPPCEQGEAGGDCG
jgi:hypothetical protein